MNASAPPANRLRLQRRTQLLGIVLVAYVLSFFHRFAPSGVAGDLALAFQTSAASLGTLAATYFAVYTLMQIPTGVLVDTIGPRRILLAGGTVATLGSLLFAMAWSLDVALIGRTLVGLGVSVVFIAMLKLIALWYDERQFATMVGLALLIGNAGGLLAGTPLTLLAGAISWRGVFYVATVISLLSTILLYFSLPRERMASGNKAQFHRTAVLKRLLGILQNRDTWPGIVANFGIAGSFFALAGLWANPYLVHVHGMSQLQASHHLSVYVGGFALGAATLGRLSDRIARRKPIILGTTLICCAITLFLVSGLPLPRLTSFPLMLTLGFCTAGFTLTWACVKEVNPPELSGMSTSVANMGGFLAAAMLQPGVGAVMGLLWDGSMRDGVPIYARGDYLAGIGVIALFTVLGTLACFFVRETHARNIWQSQTTRDI